MGGHGGLNILPQKKWNVYNFDNREKVKKDEEDAEKDEQKKREITRKRDSEFRIQQLRNARGIAPAEKAEARGITPAEKAEKAENVSELEPEFKSKLNHINLFEGIRIFDPVEGEREVKKMKVEKVKVKKKEEVRVVLPEDEKYRLGYGVAGKGVKLPWYMSRPIDERKSGKNDSSDDDYDVGANDAKHGANTSGKKTLEKLREERLMREKKEKERERALIMEKRKRDGAGYRDMRSSRR